jgi:ComF family protein
VNAPAAKGQERRFLMRLAFGAHTVGLAALDALLPPQCLTCEAPVRTVGAFCAACQEATSFVAEPCCVACGISLANEALARSTFGSTGAPWRVCRGCALAPPPWGRARAALHYDAQAKRLVLPLKYSDRIELAPALAAMMLRAGPSLVRDAQVLVPVPLHRRRLMARRYNQAALLAHALGKLAKTRVSPDALRRVRATRSLGEMGAAARHETVEGAFAVPPNRLVEIAGRRVLLIDDVLTSGATCSACTEALFDAGAASVDVLVAARVGTASW